MIFYTIRINIGMEIVKLYIKFTFSVLSNFYALFMTKTLKKSRAELELKKKISFIYYFITHFCDLQLL